MTQVQLPKVFYLVGIVLGLFAVSSVIMFSTQFFLKEHSKHKRTFVNCVIFALLGFATWFVSHFVPKHHTIFFDYLISALWTVFLVFSANFVNQLIDFYVWNHVLIKKDGRSVATTFVKSISAILVYLIFVLLIIALVFRKEAALFAAFIGGASVILGFSATDILKELFAGVALNVNPAFVIGDYLKIDDWHAKVVDINWRYVILKDIEANSIYVPNTDMIQHNVYNYTRNNSRTRLMINFYAHLNLSPQVVTELLVQELKRLPYLAKKDEFEENVVVHIKECNEFSIEYEVRLLLKGFEHYFKARTQAYKIIWCILQNQEIAFNTYRPFVHIDDDRFGRKAALKHTESSALNVLSTCEFLSGFNKKSLSDIANKASIQEFIPSQVVLEEGQFNNSYYFIERGKIVVSKGDREKIIEKGGVIGIQSALLDEKSRYTAEVLEHVIAYKVHVKEILPYLSKVKLSDLTDRISKESFSTIKTNKSLLEKIKKKLEAIQ